MFFCLILGITAARSLAANVPTLGNVSVKTITFAATDGLKVTARLYAPFLGDHPFVILYHQAGWSRGEYKETAFNLNAMGFNALAVDQRSGGTVNGIRNQTHARAKRKKLPTTYLDAYADMEAALSFVKQAFRPKQLLLLGSSYSAALVFRLAAEHPQAIVGVLAFSPGEYFAKLGTSATYIQGFAKQLEIPVFITSAREEKTDWQAIYDAIPGANKTAYLPTTTTGQHGSRALWPDCVSPHW